MLRPLFINRAYLFADSPGGECMRSFVKSLDFNTFEPTIYGSERSPLVDSNGGTVVLTHDYRSIQYIAAGVRRVLSDLTYLPGYEWYSWGIGCKRKILKDIRNGAKFDYIHSISFPCASHIVAQKVKQETGLPWVAQFYDPWADNPYRNFRTNFFKKIDWQQERNCVEKADVIIHNNEAIASLWRRRYGEELGKKIVVLPLTIPLPSSTNNENTHQSGDNLTISHIGNFMRNRTSIPFINAVIEFVKRHPGYRTNLHVNYIGVVTESEVELIKKNHLDDIFNIVGSIPAEACVDFYMKSDIFLAIDGVNKDNLFFPSKILKYLYYCRPILGITPKGSVLDVELHQSGHTSIENNNIEGIIDYLERAMNNYGTLLNFDYMYWHRFEPCNVADNYKKMIRDILKLKA